MPAAMKAARGLADPAEGLEESDREGAVSEDRAEEDNQHLNNFDCSGKRMFLAAIFFFLMKGRHFLQFLHLKKILLPIFALQPATKANN